MTRIFGAYVSSISSSATWGGDGGSCQATLVEDPQSGVLASIPQVGTPVSISIGAFSFGGLLQRSTYKESISGRTYDVVIESAAKLLDGIQVILTDFNGTWFSSANPYSPSSGFIFGTQVPNIYNVFAHHENYSYGGTFGGAEVNSAGILAYGTLSTIQQISTGGSIFGGAAQFGNHYYRIDLSELIPYFNGVQYRLKGPVQSLASIIQECCDIAGLDYFVQLVGDNIANTISNPIIKIKTIQRGFQPQFGIIENYINSARSSGTLISADYGNEWANTTSQRLVVGGPASRFIVQTLEHTIPVWGKTQNNEYVLHPNSDSSSQVYYNPTAPVPILLDEYSTAVNYFASVFELRMATGGKESWEAFKSFETIFGVERNGYNNISNAPWLGAIEATQGIFNRITSGRATSIDLQPTSESYIQKRYNAQLTERSDKIFAAVSRVATNFFGQVFMARLNVYEPGGASNNIRFIVDDIQYESQWDIADSAFTDERPFNDVSFYDNAGKLRGGAAWAANPKYDYSALGSEWAITPDGGIATTKGGPDKDIYWINGQPHVIVRSGGQVLGYDSFTTPDLGLSYLYYLFSGQFLNPSSYLTSGAQNVQISIPPAIIPPVSFGIPQQSNTYSWGPWWAWGGGLPSKAEVIFDESLVPETFGSRVLLDQAGFASARSGLSSVGVNETGTIELVGSPAFNIADRLSGVGPYISGIDINIGVDGERVTYKFNNWTPSFGKMSKTNIDRVSRIYKGSLALAQRNRSQIQKKPLPKIRFEKSDLSVLSSMYTQPSPNMIHSFINQLT